LKPLSIGDLIRQFKQTPTTAPKANPAQEWFNGFQEWLANDYEKVVHHDRKPGLHASALGSVCARRNMLVEAFGFVPSKHTAGNYFTFDVGHALHYWWQERYLGPKQELIGDWMCVACPCARCGPRIAQLGDISLEAKREVWKSCDACRHTGRKVIRGLMPMECSCGVPWQDAIRYLELPVVDKDLDYCGHTDGVLNHQPKKRLFEFKTISPSEYERNFIKVAVPEPKHDHVVQAHAYMAPLGLDEALIVYEHKGSQCKWKVDMFGQFVAGEPKVLPFLIQFDEELWAGIVMRIHDHHKSVEVINDYREQGVRLPRASVSEFERVCSDNKCELAKRCPVSRECFVLD